MKSYIITVLKPTVLLFTATAQWFSSKNLPW